MANSWMAECGCRINDTCPLHATMSAHTRHTPWIHEGQGVIRDQLGQVVAVTGTSFIAHGDLLAAAPALLDIVREAVAKWDEGDVFGNHTPEPPAVAKARALLKEIEG